MKDLLKKINDRREEVLDDCWQYHGKMIKGESDGACKSRDELEDYFGHLTLEEWEDVGFFVGYLAGLDHVSRLIEDEK